jgi:hypothetical protein
MELEVLKWVVMLLLGVGGWFMRNMVSNTQEDIKYIKQDIDKLKQEKLSKDDFKEFKVELREMFNEIKTDIRDLKSNGAQ